MRTFQPPAFITADSVLEDEYSRRRLSRLAQSGSLIRVRRGLYLPTEQWLSLKPWERHRVLVQAVNTVAINPPVFARESAAEILRLPVIGVPQEVQTVVVPNGNGSRSGRGVRRLNTVAGDPEPWRLHGLLVTPPTETARDLAVRLPLTRSLPAMDKLLQVKDLPGCPRVFDEVFTAAHVMASAARLPNSAQQRRVARVLDAAQSNSGSPGESFSRAVMIEHGLPAPELQRRFSDDSGYIGIPDFTWEEFKILGEFDGFEKYSAQKYLKGKTPVDVVVAEKKREDRLRALGYRVVRWTWDDLRNPERLIRFLRNAGLPAI